VVSPGEEKEEHDIIYALDTYVVIEYIKSSVDIILNLKFEEIEKRLMDKTSLNGGTFQQDSTSYRMKKAS
jgi:hypothetical protein